MIYSCLRVSELFRDLDEAAYRELTDHSKLIRLKHGDLVWNQFDWPKYCFVMKRGVVAIKRKNLEGHESTFGLFGPHETIGLLSLLGHRRYPATAYAITDNVEIIQIDADFFKEFRAKHHKIEYAINETLLKFNDMLKSKIDMLSAGSVESRLTSLFRYLAEKFGDENEEGNTTIPIHLTRAEMACLVDARIETVIRVLSKWQRSGFLDNKPERFILKGLPTVESPPSEAFA